MCATTWLSSTDGALCLLSMWTKWSGGKFQIKNSPLHTAWLLFYVCGGWEWHVYAVNIDMVRLAVLGWYLTDARGHNRCGHRSNDACSSVYTYWSVFTRSMRVWVAWKSTTLCWLIYLKNYANNNIAWWLPVHIDLSWESRPYDLGADCHTFGAVSQAWYIRYSKPC